jgi:hypothetical protein
LTFPSDRGAVEPALRAPIGSNAVTMDRKSPAAIAAVRLRFVDDQQFHDQGMHFCCFELLLRGSKTVRNGIERLAQTHAEKGMRGSIT